MPGSGFAQTFIGMDVIVVMFLIRKARKLARKWGGQCIIFIDEIDAVGLRRQALGNALRRDAAARSPTSTSRSSTGRGARLRLGRPHLETAAWREHLFASRAPGVVPVYRRRSRACYGRINDFIVPGGDGRRGRRHGAQPAADPDGRRRRAASSGASCGPTASTTSSTPATSSRAGSSDGRCGCRPPKPRPEQIYFIGATNVPIDRLDPALIRPGRMGRHVWFRTPTKDDRADIFDLYLGKVDHDADLDTPERRDELARITNGYSPAMIEQVCSMALTYAHADGPRGFAWEDIVEAITTIESGTAQNIDYVAEESALDGDPRGRPRGRQPRLHAVAPVDAPVDPQARRLARPPPGDEKRSASSRWRHEEVAELVLTLGAMAAEHVFYGENCTGVGGDVQSATIARRCMVGFVGHGPEPVDLRPSCSTATKARGAPSSEYHAPLRAHRPEDHQPLARHDAERRPDRGDPRRSRTSAAPRAISSARPTSPRSPASATTASKSPTIADELVERKELFGDEVLELLDRRARGARHRHHRRDDLAEAVSTEHDSTRAARPGGRRRR